MKIQMLAVLVVCAIIFSGHAAENVFVGSDSTWATDANWSLGRAPTAEDDVRIDVAMSVLATDGSGVSVRSLTVSAGSLVLSNVTLSVSGDLTVSGTGRLRVQAGPTDGIDYAKPVESAARLWANRLDVTIGGKLTVGAGATLHSANDPITGTPVVFHCAELEVAAGGTITSANSGYGWTAYTDTAPAGSWTWGGKYYTYGFGSGRSGYNDSGSYGGQALVNTFGVYGYRAAPFLPGSPVGIFNYPEPASPGSIVIFAAGALKIAGTVTSSALDAFRYGTNSGGGIWLAGATAEIPDSAVIAADGGIGGHAGGYDYPGGGGRVAICLGVTDAELDACAGGAEPEGLVYADAGSEFCTAAPGIGNNGTGRKAGAGTTLLVYRAETVQPRLVTATPAKYGTPSPAYGFYAFPPASEPDYESPGSVNPDGWRGKRRIAPPTKVVTDSGVPTVNWTFDGTEVLCRFLLRGTGSVTYGGQSHSSEFEAWVPIASPAQFDAQVTSAGFLGWYGDLPEPVTGTSLTLSVENPLVLQAVFADAPAETRTYTGAANGFWDEATNWTPAGVPSPLDDLTIPAGTSVRGLNALAAHSLRVAGSLALGGQVANATTEQTMTDVKGGVSGLWLSGDLSVSGCLTLGSRAQTTPIVTAEVRGDVTVSGSGSVAVYAGINQAEVKEPFLGVYAARQVVTIGGNFAVNDTAVVYPVADALSGTPVEWRVGGDFTLASGAKVDAHNLGFDWVAMPDERKLAASTRNGVVHYVLSPGMYKSGSYVVGACYGAGRKIGNETFNAYGNCYAPFMPGSPSSTYNWPTDAGGGVAWIHAAGEMHLAGVVTADGIRNGGRHSGNSGGSIWLLAKKMTAESTARLTAIGGDCPKGYTGYGTGGRIALMIGLQDSQVEAIVNGTPPAEAGDIVVSDTISLVDVSVLGGCNAKDGSGTFAPSGTVATMTGADADVTVTVTAAPALATGVNGPSYGPVGCAPNRTSTFTATPIASVPGEEMSVRYACQGWVCSNATDEVSSGTGVTAEVAVGKEPLTLTWLWGARETRATADANDADLGSVTVDGVASEAPAAWVGQVTPISFEAVPAEGSEFLYWVGEVPFGKALDNPLVFTGYQPRHVTAVFRTNEVATTRRWIGPTNGRGDWLDAKQWDPAGVPGREDDVVISSGTCEITNVLAVGSLTIDGSAIVRLAASTAASDCRCDITSYHWNGAASTAFYPYERPFADERIEEARLVVGRDLTLKGKGQLTVGTRGQGYRASLVVGGDLRLLETNRLCVVAGRMEGDFTYARGAGFVTVGGTFEVAGESIVYPVCEGYTGGGVVFRAKRVSVGPDAQFDATRAGFQLDPNRYPYSLAPGMGWDYTTGAGYGGRGVGNQPDYGKTYGQEYAPVHPGSHKGTYGDNGRSGGGLIRIHAYDVTLEGLLDAQAMRNNAVSGGSGGGIWVTATRRLEIGPAARLLANGGSEIIHSGWVGGGGRIALAIGVTTADVEELAATGHLARYRATSRHYAAAERFLAEHPTVTVDVSPGREQNGGAQKYTDPAPHTGTFRVVDARMPGLTIIIR